MFNTFLLGDMSVEMLLGYGCLKWTTYKIQKHRNKDGWKVFCLKLLG